MARGGGTGKGGRGPRSANQIAQGKRAGASGSIAKSEGQRGSEKYARKQERRAVPWSGKGDPF